MSNTNVVAMEAAPAPARAVTPMDLVNAAVTQGASPEALEKLLALHERWQAGQARAAFNQAMASALPNLPLIARKGTVERGKDGGVFRHERLQDIAEAVKPHLEAQGLVYRFRSETPPGGPITVTCIISHVDGHSEETSLSAPMDTSGGKNNVQGVGSTVTYLQRYTLKLALGLAVDKDDDGESSETDTREADWIACITECKSIPELRAYCHGIAADVEAAPLDVRKRVAEAKEAAKQRLFAARDGAAA